MLFYYWRLA